METRGLAIREDNKVAKCTENYLDSSNYFEFIF